MKDTYRKPQVRLMIETILGREMNAAETSILDEMTEDFDSGLPYENALQVLLQLEMDCIKPVIRRDKYGLYNTKKDEFWGYIKEGIFEKMMHDGLVDATGAILRAGRELLAENERAGDKMHVEGEKQYQREALEFFKKYGAILPRDDRP